MAANATGQADDEYGILLKIVSDSLAGIAPPNLGRDNSRTGVIIECRIRRFLSYALQLPHCCSISMTIDRINFLDLSFDRLSFEDVKHQLEMTNASTPYAYIVTPNVNHMVQVHSDPNLRELYDDAIFCVCDSRILRILARLSGIRLPLIAGSDLVEALFSDVIRPGEKIALIGGTDEFLGRLCAKFPHFNFLHHAPPMGLRHNVDARQCAAKFIATSNARFAFIAVGMPQQEMVAWEVRKLPNATGVALCIGAGLEFLTGEQKRAPRFLRALNLEWAHRLATNPRRLWRRYLGDGLKILPIYLRWLKSRGR